MIRIAIDGPSSAGKSTVAKQIARDLSIIYVDTGAMYRAIGLTALEKGVPVQDEQAVTALCQALSMTVGHAADGQHTLVDGRDVTGFIRTPEVSMAASTVAKYAGVRAAMVALQRRLAQETPMLVDGRDIGTRVLMNAPVKIFLTASAEERARRRYRQQIDRDPKTLEKLVRQFDRQQVFQLTGPDYVRSKGQVSDLLRPWYQKKSLTLSHEVPLDESLYSPDFASRVTEDLKTLLPFYRLSLIHI